MGQLALGTVDLTRRPTPFDFASPRPERTPGPAVEDDGTPISRSWASVAVPKDEADGSASRSWIPMPPSLDGTDEAEADTKTLTLPRATGRAEADAKTVSLPRLLPDQRVVDRFVALYTEQYGRVVAYARRRLGDQGAAEDCAAEVFRIAWEHAEQGVPGAGWLFVTARNTILHQQRSAARANALSQAAASEISRRRDLEADEANQVARVRQALDELPADQRELLMAHYLDGLSGAECGALLSCSTGAVWVRLHRARAALRRSYEELADLPVEHDATGRTTSPKRVP